MDIDKVIMDIHNSIMDIHNWIMDIHNWIMDIQKSIMDIHNSIYAMFTWGPEQQGAFEVLKELLVSSRVMAHPDTSKPCKLYTDACDYAIGAILVQEDGQGVEHPICLQTTVQNSGPQSRRRPMLWSMH